MYNPYLPQNYDIEETENNSALSKQAPITKSSSKNGLLQILKGLKLEEIDTGDVLLLLILLFLFLDDREDNLELLITLGLMLIL